MQFLYQSDHSAFQQHADSKTQSPTDKFVFRYNQSNVRQEAPPSDRRLPRVVIKSVVYSSDHGTVLGRSRKLGGAAKHLIDGSEKRISRFEL